MKPVAVSITVPNGRQEVYAFLGACWPTTSHSPTT